MNYSNIIICIYYYSKITYCLIQSYFSRIYEVHVEFNVDVISSFMHPLSSDLTYLTSSYICISSITLFKPSNLTIHSKFRGGSEI